MFSCNVTAVEVPSGTPKRIELARHASARSVEALVGTQRRTSPVRRWSSRWAKTKRRKRRRREAALARLGHPEQFTYLICRSKSIAPILFKMESIIDQVKNQVNIIVN